MALALRVDTVTLTAYIAMQKKTVMDTEYVMMMVCVFVHLFTIWLKIAALVLQIDTITLNAHIATHLHQIAMDTESVITTLDCASALIVLWMQPQIAALALRIDTTSQIVLTAPTRRLAMATEIAIQQMGYVIASQLLI